jgi:predicted dithiol-disulfide oxidoreductase (DUF899 family)
VSYSRTMQQLNEYRQQIAKIRAKMRLAQQLVEPEPVQDYELAAELGPVRLSELFGRHSSLYVIHNMGSGCAYCTLWADGYNGIYAHLASRAAFVVSSPDAPAAQRSFAESRGWRFRMVSHRHSTFARDMGYCPAPGKYRPGVSVFQQRADGLVRVSDSGSEPLDDFNPLWHLLELLPEGPDRWRPRIEYR